jgi:hypothetical protein
MTTGGICTRKNRLISSASIVLALLMLLPLKQTLSQRPSVSADSARRDSMPTDSLRAADCAACFFAIPAGGVMILSAIFAAAPLALFIGERGPSEMSFLQDHGAASASVGGAFQAGQTWADAVRIERFDAICTTHSPWKNFGGRRTSNTLRPALDTSFIRVGSRLVASRWDS